MYLKYLILLIVSMSSCTTSLKSGSYTEKSTDINGKEVITRVDTNVTVGDTFFLKRKERNGIVTQRIFIDPKRSAQSYQKVFKLDETDHQNVKYYSNELVKKRQVLNHTSLGDLPAEWRPVVKFNNKYYLYNPGDMGEKATVMLTDSTLMRYFFGDGYLPIALTSVKKESDDFYVIKATHYVDVDRACPSVVNITVLNEKTKLSVWQFKNEDTSEYMLMIPRETMTNLPIIVNAVKMKGSEFNFEDIDYKKLLKNK